MRPGQGRARITVFVGSRHEAEDDVWEEDGPRVLRRRLGSPVEPGHDGGYVRWWV